MLNKEKKTAVYEHEQIVTDPLTGEILKEIRNTVSKVSAEPDYIKVYYETMMSFNQIHNIPVQFVLSISKYIEWSNEGSPQFITLTKRIKEDIMKDCNCCMSQIAKLIKLSVDNGLLFRTEYRATYEVNPFMIAKGKWDSIRKLRTQFDFVGGKWIRTMEREIDDNIISHEVVSNMPDEEDEQASFGSVKEFDDYVKSFKEAK